MTETKTGAAAIESFLARLGSDAVTPGSGAAAAVVLALAAACTSKAIQITAKHRPLSEALQSCRPQLAQLQAAALRGADEDGERFRSFLHHPDAATAERLRETDGTLIDLTQSLNELIDRISGEIHEIVEGDILAARALLAAARSIHQHNRSTID